MNAYKTLEFDIILKRLADLAMSDAVKNRIMLLTPSLKEDECNARMQETTDARRIMDTFGTPPIASMLSLDKLFALAEKGSMLTEEQLSSIATFITTCRRVKAYLKKAEDIGVKMASYGNSFNDLEFLYEEIDRSIRNNLVDDFASADLRGIRRRIENANSSIKAKLESMLRSRKECFSDGYIATRNGRLVLPVKKEFKGQVTGSVVDTSSTGGTLFIEPTAVRKFSDELAQLQIDEDNEVRRILYTLTSLVDDCLPELKINKECMEVLDFAFAKAKLSVEMKANPPHLTTDRRIVIKNGKHPLLEGDKCVPLDFNIGDTVNGVIITGPNTGGKTVALKTVGLLSIMAQCGLHISADNDSIICINSNVLCDIGDGQSISENLSTFSSHITNIIEILRTVSSESLVLLDELGSGTDPAEGMGIAISILDELRKSNCLFIATTHYPEVKDFASDTDGLINARMEFDRESLKPMYKLKIGEAGESCALYIAKRLGLPQGMLKRAYSEAYRSHIKSDDTILDLEEDIIQGSYSSKVIKSKAKSPASRKCDSFNIGDSVLIYPQKEMGLVYRRASEKGELGVQIKGKKKLINYKRVKLVTPASELYPDDYDFSIIFDSVENRKAKRIMNKRHDSSLSATYNADESGWED